MLDALLEGRGSDPAFLRNAATVLGLPEDGPMLCVVAPIESAGEYPLRAPQEAMATQDVSSAWFVRPRDEVGLISLGARPAAGVVDAVRSCVIGRAGASPVVAGLGAIDAGYRMAQTAARTLDGPGLAVLDDRLP